MYNEMCITLKVACNIFRTVKEYVAATYQFSFFIAIFVALVYSQNFFRISNM